MKTGICTRPVAHPPGVRCAVHGLVLLYEAEFTSVGHHLAHGLQRLELIHA